MYRIVAGLFLLGVCLGVSAVGMGAETVQVPIIMYHSLVRSGSSTGIGAEEFEADLKYLQEHGYQAVHLSDLVDFVHHGMPLPEKPIVLTFDDGYYNNYSLGLPLVQRYDTKIVVSVIGRDTEIWSENPAGIDEKDGHLTWDQIGEMVDTGLVEIGNHTWDLHKIERGRKGCAMKVGEDRTQYRQMLWEDVGRLQDCLGELSGVRPIGFTYPFGNLCPEAGEILREMGFLVTLSCYDGVNTLVQGDEACLYEMRRYDRSPERSVREILEDVVGS